VEFGKVSDRISAAPYVTSVATLDGQAFAAVSTGAVYELWYTKTGSAWTRTQTPIEPTTAGDHTMVIAARDAGNLSGSGPSMLLLADDGSGGQVWTGVRKS
jgi:hypothetical protein